MTIDNNIKTLREYLKCTGVGMTEFTYALDSVVSTLEAILKEEEPLQALIEEYKTQDNRITAYPIYVTVQELVSIGVMADGYSVNCPYDNGEVKQEHNCDCCDGNCDDDREHCEEDVPVGYIWNPVEFFLTIKGAEQYMKANAHNHGKLRTYVHHFERRNFEMRKLLRIFGFQTQVTQPLKEEK